MTTNENQIKVGDVGFGSLNGYPPTHWRFGGKLNGSWILEHVKHPGQSGPAYSPQGVTWSEVERIMANR